MEGSLEILAVTCRPCLYLLIVSLPFSYQDSEEKEFSSFVVQALKPAVCLVSSLFHSRKNVKQYGQDCNEIVHQSYLLV